LFYYIYISVEQNNLHHIFIYTHTLKYRLELSSVFICCTKYVFT